jgi:hypothetical protein
MAANKKGDPQIMLSRLFELKANSDQSKDRTFFR